MQCVSNLIIYITLVDVHSTTSLDSSMNEAFCSAIVGFRETKIFLFRQYITNLVLSQQLQNHLILSMGNLHSHVDAKTIPLFTICTITFILPNKFNNSSVALCCNAQACLPHISILTYSYAHFYLDHYSVCNLTSLVLESGFTTLTFSTKLVQMISSPFTTHC